MRAGEKRGERAASGWAVPRGGRGRRTHQHTCVNALMNGLMYGLVSDSITSVTIATKMTNTMVCAKSSHTSTAHVRSSLRIGKFHYGKFPVPGI